MRIAQPQCGQNLWPSQPFSLLCLFVSVICLPFVAEAANLHYIRAGASGSNNGSDWTNAWTDLPSTFTRGDTYYVADGNYGPHNFSTANSGTTYITIKKATITDHGTDTGWDNFYGDGVAEFIMAGSTERLRFDTSYWILDGQVGGGPSNWSTGHGFKLTNNNADPNMTDDYRGYIRFGDGWSWTYNPSHIEIRHTEITSTYRDQYDLDGAIYVGNTDPCNLQNRQGPNNITIDYCYIHDIGLPISSHHCQYWTFEYNYIARNDVDYEGSNQSTAWWDNSSDFMTIRYNIFEDNCGTGNIDIKKNWHQKNTGWEIYGNVFYYTSGTAVDSGCGNGIIVDTGGATDPRDDCNNMLIYNNTFINEHGNQMGVYFNGQGSHDNLVYNNLWYSCRLGAHKKGVTGVRHVGVSHDYNLYVYSPFLGGESAGPHEVVITQDVNPFVDWMNKDFRLNNSSSSGLAAINTGYNVGAPYNIDMNGTIRGADGGWDIGAYEYEEQGSGNHAPVLGEIGNKSVNENALLTFTVSATDADNDTITYSATGLPTGAIFSDQTFNWMPRYDQAGTHNVTFVATDEHGAQSSPQTVVITVNNVNRPPVLAAIGDKPVSENITLSFPISATDPDGDAITYSVDVLPSGAIFTNQTFSWTPGYNQAGSYDVNFIAGDGQAQDSETITITVNNVNRPPVLGSIGNKSVYVNDLLTFTVSGTDPDGGPIEYSASGLPSGATFAGQSFNWQPDNSQVGSHQVTFLASDGQLQDSESIAITVLSTDTSPPVVANCSPVVDSIQVPLNTLVTLHVTDAGKGVDANSVIIKVDGDIIYSGNTLNYSSAHGNCRRSGTKADYTFVCQSNEMFDFDQAVTVTVNAADLAGNVMSQYSYSFTTEMRSFGQNKKVGSGSDTLAKAAPATVQDSAGNIWAVWQAGSAGSRDIYISKLAAGADNFGSSLRLTQSTADQCNPAAAIDSADKFYVAWQDNRSGNWDIYVSTSSDGITWSAEQKVTDSNDNQINPAIAVDTSNRAYIVWQDDRNKNQDIYIAASSNGFANETVSQITPNGADQTEPAIAVGSSNAVYVVWTDARNGLNDTDIYGAASGLWTNVPIVSRAGNQSSPAIAAELEGSVLHLLCVDDRSGNQDIYYATSNGLPGSPLSDSGIIRIIDDASGANQSAPVIITNSSSKVFACWQDQRNVTVNGDTDLYFAELNSDSRTNIFVGDDSTNSDQSEPAIGIGEYGHPYLVWTDARSANTEIYYAASTFVEPVALKAKDVSASLGATVGTEPASISSVDDVSVVVPPGACSCDVKITISKIKNPQAFTMQCLGSYDFGPSGMQFSQPVTVTIPYTISSSITSASAYYYNSLTGATNQLGMTDVENLQISSTLYALRFKTTHFTAIYVLGSGSERDDSGEGDDGGGGGGGGGGCSISAGGEANFVEFIVPYIGLTVVMVILKLRDRRNRKARNIAESIHPS